MESTLSIQFAKGGYVLFISKDNGVNSVELNSTEVFVSTGKLIKAVRVAIDELSLIPKKANDAEADA